MILADVLSGRIVYISIGFNEFLALKSCNLQTFKSRYPNTGRMFGFSWKPESQGGIEVV